MMPYELTEFQKYVARKAVEEHEKSGGFRVGLIPRMPEPHEQSIAPKQFVYAIECGGFIKLGRTHGETPERRRQELQTASPIEMKLLHHAEVPDSCKAERILHETYANFRTSGEWFKIPRSMLPELRVAFAEISQL